ncbi:MAG: ABC transporter permease subunit [Candidatus Buchananbacteria bacterium]|nr:ABC transporter permease subunit [Candidatus Buchananbacteria bacterium]
MHKFLILLKKEIKELITPQLVIPLIIMVFIFAGIGGLLSKETAETANQQKIWLVDYDNTAISQKVIESLENKNLEVQVFDNEIEKIIDQAQTNNIKFFLAIPQGFAKKINSLERADIIIYNLINNFSFVSSLKTAQVQSVLAIINQDLAIDWAGKIDLSITPQELNNPVIQQEYVVINDRQAKVPLTAVLGFVQQQTTFIPIILFLVIVLASQMVAMAVATEKENKTFETLLSSPISRKLIVFAKLLAAGIVALLFAGFYMIGFNYYLQGISGGQITQSGAGIQEALIALGIEFGITSYILLGLSLFMGILVALAIAMILGIMADSVKSIQAVTTPLMVIILIPYFLIMFLDIQAMSPIIKYLIYIIPFSHPFLAAQKIVTHEYSFIIYGIIYQLIIFLVFVIVAAKIFSSDKVFTLRLGRKK